MATNTIEKAQRKVEGRNFDIRKNLLKYDNVANDQRKVVYAQRDSLLDTDDVSETIADLHAEVVNTLVDQFVPPESLEEQWVERGLECAGKGKPQDGLHPVCSISLNFPKPTTAQLRR